MKTEVFGKMKILFVLSNNHERGITPIVGNQAEALVEAGVKVDFFYINGKGWLNYLKSIIQLRRYLRTNHYYAIHAHYSFSGYVASLAGAKPLVVSLMGSDVKDSNYLKFLIPIFAKLFRWRALIVKSRDMYRDLGVEWATVFPNGVNTERFQPRPKEENQKHLGWEPKKKHILFPANIARQEKDYALAEAAIKEFVNGGVRELEIEVHSFDDYTPNAETRYWYNAADVVLLTSVYEGSPNAIKEAMACSLPIVSTNVGDVEERMSGVEGCYVVDSREPKDVAEAIEKALAFKGMTKGREKIFADGIANVQSVKKLKEIYNIVQTQRVIGG